MDEAAAHKEKDYTGAKIGMWLFLFTEVCLFFGPFLLYAVYSYRYPEGFSHASAALDRVAGAVNTVVLISSSLTMALSVSAARLEDKGYSQMFLFMTIGLGVFFLFNKYFEWSGKISHGIYPGSQALLEKGAGERIFYGLYYFSTGLHGLHVLAGVGLLTVVAFMRRREGWDLGNVRLENSALYWHLVDIIWIYLFPLFYLIS